MENVVKEKENDACNFAGIWNDGEYIDADELVKTLHESRRFKDRYEFWDTIIEEDN